MGGSLYCSWYPLRNSDLYLNHFSEVLIQNATLSASIERPPPEPPPYVKQISCFGSMDLLPPSTQKMILVPHPSSMLNLVRPPRKLLDKSGMLYGFSLSVRTLSVFVQIFWCIKGLQVVEVKIAHYVFVGMPVQRRLIWKTKIWQGLYGAVINFCNPFMFWMSFNLLIKVDIVETTYSRNALATVVNLIRNWIDKIKDRGFSSLRCHGSWKEDISMQGVRF